MKRNLEIDLEPPDGNRLSGRFCVGNGKNGWNNQSGGGKNGTCRSELKAAFEQKPAMAANVSLSADLAVAIQQFSEVNSLFLSGEVRLASATTDVTAPLQLLKTNENMFISPGDLLLHCTNLKDVGTITS